MRSGRVRAAGRWQNLGCMQARVSYEIVFRCVKMMYACRNHCRGYEHHRGMAISVDEARRIEIVLRGLCRLAVTWESAALWTSA